MENLTSDELRILERIKKTINELDEIQLLEVIKFAQNLKKIPRQGEKNEKENGDDFSTML